MLVMNLIRKQKLLLNKESRLLFVLFSQRSVTFSKDKIVKPALLLFMGKFSTIIHKIKSIFQTDIIILAIFQIRYLFLCQV